MGKRKKVIMIVAVVLVVLVVAQLFALGWFVGMGPLGFLRDYKYGRLPGNADVYSPDTVAAMENSPLEGGRICFLGSSVTAGSASMGNSMAVYLGKRFDCDVTLEAVSGTTLVDNGKNSYVQRIQNNIDPDAEFSLFVCQLSTNDATQGKPLGEVAEGNELDDFDTSTIAGAMEYIICYAQKNWDCPVMFYTGSRYDSAEYGKMVDLLYTLQEKWSVGIIDLWSGEEFNDITEEERSLYMDDDIHPTMAGYKVWWTPEMERQILDFLNKR